jgi:prepilin-type processing-associated H-X9-DG protein
MNNLRQIHLSWQLYADDFAGWLVPNGSGVTSGKSVDNPSWVAGSQDFRPNNPDNFDTRLLIDPTYLYGGMLGAYAQNAGIFRCPSDRSMAPDGGQPRLRMRSYSLNIFMNARRGLYQNRQIFRKVDQLRRPVLTFTFLEQHPVFIGDGEFNITPSIAAPHVVDVPAANHGKHGNLSFADGHLEKHRWRYADSPVNLTAGHLAEDIEWLWERSSDPD